MINDHGSHIVICCVCGSFSELCLCFDPGAVEEQEATLHASCACSDVHGPGQPELGLDLDGALDGGYEAVGEPDRGAGQWPWRGESRRPNASSGRLDSDTHDDDARGQ